MGIHEFLGRRVWWEVLFTFIMNIISPWVHNVLFLIVFFLFCVFLIIDNVTLLRLPSNPFTLLTVDR